MSFQVHPRLQQDSIEIGQLNLCRILLINDSQYPWFVLVPTRENIHEIYQLKEQDQLQLQRESCLLAKKLAKIYSADKINIAAIGNIVSQLHIHHIVRYKNDIAWPAPVWGKFDAIPYKQEQIEETKTQLITAMGSLII